MLGFGGGRTVINNRDPVSDRERNYDIDRKIQLQKHRDNRVNTGGVAGLGDVAVGDEDNDLTMAELVQYRQAQASKDSLKARFNVWYLIFAGTMGGLLGSVLGAMQFHKMFRGEAVNYEAATNTVMGCFAGAILGVVGTSLWQCLTIYCKKGGRFQKEIEANREALRRKEQEAIERHDEFVYYDAARAQSRLYKLCCCSHYGKITSERIIYSENRYAGPFRCTFKYFLARLMGLFNKDVESLDYDFVLDVSVEQGYLGACQNVGDVILHCEASNDLSVIKKERSGIVRALKAQDEAALRVALLSAGNIRPLRKLVIRAKNEILKLQEERRKQCQEAGQPFVVMYVEEENKSNTSKKIRVKDVVRPYAVLDDLSYKISKAMKSTTRERILQDLERSSEMFGDATEFMSEPELAQIQVVSQTGMSKVPTA